MNVMQAYIDEQPRICAGLLARWEQIAAPAVQRLAAAPIGRVVLFGSGSSYHAAVMAAPFFARALGVEATPVVSTRLDDLTHLADPVYFAVSQGGRSTNTYDTIGALQARGIPVIAVTETADTPVAQRADGVLTLPIGEETIGAKTKGVTASALVLLLTALALGRARGTADPAWVSDTLDGLHRWAACLPDNLARAAQWCQSACPLLAPARHLYVLAKGAARGGALEGGLKLLETTYRPVSVYEFEEYLHGVQNALDADSYLLCIDPTDGDRARMRRLMDFAQAQGAHCLCITQSPDSVRGTHDLLLADPACDALASLTCLPALQTLSAQLSAYCGIDVTQRRYPDFFARMESKL